MQPDQRSEASTVAQEAAAAGSRWPIFLAVACSAAYLALFTFIAIVAVEEGRLRLYVMAGPWTLPAMFGAGEILAIVLLVAVVPANTIIIFSLSRMTFRRMAPRANSESLQ